MTSVSYPKFNYPAYALEIREIVDETSTDHMLIFQNISLVKDYVENYIKHSKITDIGMKDNYTIAVYPCENGNATRRIYTLIGISSGDIIRMSSEKLKLFLTEAFGC